MKNKNIRFKYNHGEGVCTIIYKGHKFIGKALCHPDDIDFESERTGLCIAEARAYLLFLKHRKNNEIKPQLDIINHLFNNIRSSSKYDSKSYEFKMIKRQKFILENELKTINNDIKEEEKSLKEYISLKEKLYTKFRDKNQ